MIPAPDRVSLVSIRCSVRLLLAGSVTSLTDRNDFALFARVLIDLATLIKAIGCRQR